jgi:hypothetical protein
VTAWISIGISVVAVTVAFLAWWTGRKRDDTLDEREKIDRVSTALVRLSGTANNAAQGSPHAMNELQAAQQDLAIAVAAAGTELPSCRAAANAPGVLQVQAAIGRAFMEVRDATRELAT